MSKLTGCHAIFRKISIFRSNSQVPQEILKPEGDRSGGYRGDTWSVNLTWMRCWDLLSCHSCARTGASTRTIMTMPEHLDRISQFSFVKCPHQTCLQLNLWMTFWTKGLTHNTGTKKPPGSQCWVSEGIKANPWAPNHQNYSEYAK